MKKLYLLILTLLVITLSSCSDITNPGVESQNTESSELSTSKNTQTEQSSFAAKSTTESDVWVGAYLASYEHYVEPTGNWGNLPTDEIDWDAFTHLFYFALSAQSDGSLSAIEAYQNMSPDRINSAVSAAHDAGKPIVFTIGGWGNYDGFSNAIKPANRATFISNIIATMETWGFDGVDLDMEPIKSGDVDNYIAFVNDLHEALQTVDVPMLSSDPLLTAAVGGWHSDMFAQIHDKFDQINLMTYDYSGAWQGWETWHNAAVSNGGRNFTSNGNPLPSVEESVKSFVNAGVPASKLGIGIDFYGYVWSGGTGTSTGGVTKPNQTWDTAPTVTDNVAYHEIMNQYAQSGTYHWDDQAKAAYFSIDNEGSSNDKFISFDDEKSIEAKFNYVRQQGLGGTIIWELSGGYRENQPAGERDKLLQAVKNQMNNGGSTEPAPDAEEPSISINTPTDGVTVSGTNDIEIQASDNVGVSYVELIIDGVSVKNFSSNPYNYSWNTTEHANHTCSIEAIAVDEAGNSSSATLSVTVNNDLPDGSEDTGDISEGTTIYDESLSADWHNASWSASVNFGSSEQAFSGNKSIKVDQNSWGALSLRNGNWGEGVGLDPSQYEAVEIAIYAQDQNADVSLMLENDEGQNFPSIRYGTISTNQWTTIRIPMSELNPNGQVFHRIDVLETSGSAKTYFVDDFTLVDKGNESSDGDDSDGSGDNNSDDSTTESYVDVFSELLVDPWINASWNASVDFSNTEYVAAGSQSVKVQQNAWGALSLHSGNWGSVVDLNTTEYKRLEFKVYTPDSDVSFNIALKSDDGSTPTYKSGSVASNQWVTISIPMDELNPNNHLIQRLNIVETSGSKKTYYIDELRFVK